MQKNVCLFDCTLREQFPAWIKVSEKMNCDEDEEDDQKMKISLKSKTEANAIK